MKEKPKSKSKMGGSQWAGSRRGTISDTSSDDSLLSFRSGASGRSRRLPGGKRKKRKSKISNNSG